MDTSAFDGLTRLLAGGSRRDMVRALGALSAGGAFAALLGVSDTDAKRKRKGNGKGKGKGKKKRKNTPKDTPQNTPPPPPPVDHCIDGVTNEGESDVDCGGTCPRCANDKTCASRGDCANALCVANTCTSCDNGSDCGLQADGVTPCFCRDNLRFPGTRVCTNQNGRLLPPGGTCADCAANEACNPAGGANVECVLFCGAS